MYVLEDYNFLTVVICLMTWCIKGGRRICLIILFIFYCCSSVSIIQSIVRNMSQSLMFWASNGTARISSYEEVFELIGQKGFCQRFVYNDFVYSPSLEY